jgi:transcriptional regulator
MMSVMYVPAHFAASPDLLETLIDAGAIGDLITFGPAGFDSTPLPLLLVDGALHGHVARNNSQWRADGSPALVIVRGPDAYVSPGWYESTREHGRVVPTWDYEVVHVHGRLIAHDDVEWTARLVRRLTAVHEASLTAPWTVDDAPEAFIDGQLRAIVGIEIVIERIEAKAKLSQNRTPADVDGVVSALAAGDERQRAVGAAVQNARAARSTADGG